MFNSRVANGNRRVTTKADGQYMLTNKMNVDFHRQRSAYLRLMVATTRSGVSYRLHLSRYGWLVGCYQADSLFNMAAPSNAEQTQLQDMEDEGMEEREMESDEDEEVGMGVENSDDEDDDSSEDEKENEAEIQRLEEQVIIHQVSQA